MNIKSNPLKLKLKEEYEIDVYEKKIQRIFFYYLYENKQRIFMVLSNNQMTFGFFYKDKDKKYEKSIPFKTVELHNNLTEIDEKEFDSKIITALKKHDPTIKKLIQSLLSQYQQKIKNPMKIQNKKIKLLEAIKRDLKEKKENYLSKKYKNKKLL